MPTHTPRKGLPPRITWRSSASIIPGSASRPRLQSAKAPTPGSTTWLASSRSRGFVAMMTRALCPSASAAASIALAAERRFPDP